MGIEADHADECYDYGCKWCDGYTTGGGDLCDACEERGKPPARETAPLNYQQLQSKERKKREQKIKNAERMRKKRKNQTPEQKQEEREKNKLRMREARK